MFFDRFFGAFPEQTGWLVKRRDRWPRGVPVSVRTCHPTPLASADDLVLRLRIRGSGRPWLERPLSNKYYGPERWTLPDLGVPLEGSREVELEAELLAGAGLTWENQLIKEVDASTARRIWRGTLARLRVVESASDILKPVVTAAADSNIESLLQPVLARDSDGACLLRMRQVPWHIGSGSDDWALGARAEILRDGRIAARGDVLYHMPSKGMHVSFAGAYAHFDLEWLIPPPTPEQMKSDAWLVRLRGDPDVAMRDLERTSYWSGTATRRLTGVENLDEVEERLLGRW